MSKGLKGVRQSVMAPWGEAPRAQRWARAKARVGVCVTSKEASGPESILEELYKIKSERGLGGGKIMRVL